MKRGSGMVEALLYWVSFGLVCICANCFYFVAGAPGLAPLFAAGAVAANLLPLYSAKQFPNSKIKICNHGTKCLKLFALSVVVSTCCQLVLLFTVLKGQWLQWGLSVLVCVCVEAALFWNGIISVYTTSLQLGIKLRVLGIVFGPIPVAHLIMLQKIIRTTSQEVRVETEKYQLNTARHAQQVCNTKYPLLLVHGVFFRDFKYLNYWGRIPGELTANGAQVYYGEHQSAASVPDSAAELAQRIKDIVQQTGCEKVNIIAHSKGGLDCRYAICHTGIAGQVASLTTINTPHRGCKFADYLLGKVPQAALQKIAATYNAALRKMGDTNPNFIAAVTDLTSQRCATLDHTLPLPQGIVCASVGSKLNHATNGKFPLNFSHPLVKYFDGPNDGLVGEQSFRWGADYTFLTVRGNRGISHGDMIDLNRENIPGFDVREFYVQLVYGLKQQGL